MSKSDQILDWQQPTPWMGVRSSGVPDRLGTNPAGIWYSMIRPFTLATWITDLGKCRFGFWSTTIQIAPKNGDQQRFRDFCMWQFFSEVKTVYREESSYLMAKPLLKWANHQNVGRKSGTDLPLASIVPCIQVLLVSSIFHD